MKRILCIAFLTLTLASNAWAIDRRQDQSPRDPSYMFIPYAMNMPGIGAFYGIAGSYDNIAGSEADTYLATMTGDLAGYTGGLFNMPVPNEHLTLHWFTTNFNKASVESYGRGMDSDPEDMKILRTDKVHYNGFMLNLKFWEKRIHFYTTKFSGAVHPTEIADKEGKLITTLDMADIDYSGGDQGFVFDYTDDNLDPRAGLKLESRRSFSNPDSSYDPDYYIIDFTTTAFIPFGKQSTWAFNHYRSDAVVTREGETNREVIGARMGADCTGYLGAALAACEAAANAQIDQAVATNTYGTAAALGGINFLRAYPQGRYYGAHSRFYGTEMRWNFSEGHEAFDIFLAKGVRTIFQLAAFHEIGTVADQEQDLGNTWATATGVGFRVLLTSGFVFRFDVGAGKEGVASTLFFNYPWGVMN